jgi:hypothetical protein
MKKIQIISLLIAALIVFAACEKIEPPFKEDHEGGGTEPGTVVKKVLLEDYTGHKCVNCAGASKTAHDLKDIYQEQLIVMAVHAGDFALPVPGSLFSADYRTEAGNQWNDYFGVQAYPSGMVNRAEYNGDLVLTESKWGEAIAQALQTEADAEIKINNEYDNGKVTTTITVKFLHDMPDLYDLQVCVTEDSIVSAQMNADETAGETPVIEDFVFMHMLRGAVNGPWGEDIFGATIEPNKEYTVTYDYNITGVARNSHIVVFVYSQGDKSIVQVEQVPVIAEE